MQRRNLPRDGDRPILHRRSILRRLLADFHRECARLGSLINGQRHNERLHIFWIAAASRNNESTRNLAVDANLEFWLQQPAATSCRRDYQPVVLWPNGKLPAQREGL